ncbi:Peroxisome biogenesis factor 1 [Rhizoctonia solani]|uniref:Peroxisome biogenesis factor 1 n=1 Tax=Rhizoctonia solani TaxID=456999 RepID=A0A0K6FNV4_9AGAM|nr:Peroxisome biogenesis factor 1 [Rhizoctonia solani]
MVLDPEIQNRAARSTKGKSISEPTLILYCPIEGGQYVVDATVQALAEKFGADIQVLDLTRLVIEQWSEVWKDVIQPQDPVKITSPPILSSPTPSYRYPPILYPSTPSPVPSPPLVYHEVGDGYFSIHHAPDTSKLKRLVKQLVNSGSNTSEHKKRARIVYMRDFGVVAKLAPELYAAVLAEIQETLVGTGAGSVPAAIILGTSPFVNKSGLFQKSQDEDYTAGRYRRRYMYDSPPDDKPDTWDETDDAQESREKRNQRQFKMWNDGSLAAHVEGQLLGAGVFSGVAASDSIQPRPGSPPKYPRVCVVVPSTRDLAKERAVRERIRLDVNSLHVRLTLFCDQMELSGSPTELQAGADEFVQHCRNNVLVAEQVTSLINRAAGKFTSQAPNTVLTWDALAKAWQTEKKLDQERSDWIKNSNPESAKSVDLVDQVKSMDLNSYERDLLRCLIKPEQIQTTFDSVHLPAETIDIVRSLVSLPLICPDAFQTGLLKEHNMTGALFFGPPGTGKTHLARAIAKESGSRMIAVKPSDIMDKYVGESEKIIGGLFQLARRLKPCIVFIDEVDSLFGARTSGSSNCSRWRNDMLTQFAQEMDGLHVSDVVVIGTTNRPFDLDDAMVRRLPCRVLVDLPDDAAREAILKILLKNEHMEDDVDLKDLARQTMRYSGSDLKSLCVTAAYESVKELAKVPWRTSTQGDSLSNQLSLFGIHTPVPTDSGSESPTGLFVGVSSVQNTRGEVQGPEQKSVTPKPRTLAKRHFTHALMQVRASTSESQESSIKLRQWDEQFGSAKQRKKIGIEPPFRAYPRESAESGSYLRQLGII